MARKTINVVYKVDDAELRRVKATIGGAEKQTEELNKDLRRTGETAKQAGNQASQSFLSFKNIIGAISVTAIAYSMARLARTVFDLGVKQEQTNIAFETFLGSAEKAKVVIAELTKFSVVTPFTPDEVFQAGKALLAFGIEAEKLIPTLKSVGDIASGTGKNFNELAVIYGKARVQGTLFAEDINQLTEAGVPIIQEFAKQLGVTEGEVKKMGSQGRITFPMLEKGFQDLTSEGGKFFRLMDRQSQSVGGKLSTIQGNLEEIMKVLYTGNSGPVADFIGNLVTITSNINGISDAIQGWINVVGLIPMTTVKIIAGMGDTADAIASGSIGLMGTQGIPNKLKEAAENTEELNDTLDETMALFNAITIPTIERLDTISKLEVEIAKIKNESKNATAGELPLLGQRLRYYERQKELLEGILKAEAKQKKEGLDITDYLAQLSEQEMFQTKALLADRTENRKKEAEIEKENAQRSADLQQYFRDLRKRKEQEASDEIIQIMEDEADQRARIQGQIFNSVVQTLNLLVSYSGDANEERLDDLNDKYNQESALLGDNERRKQQLQSQYEKQRDQMQQRLDQQRAQQQKKKALLSIAIDTAANAVKLFAETVPPGILSAIAILFGGVQAGIVSAQKFKEGGWIRGPGSETSDSIPILASRNEYMVNAAAAKQSPRLLEAINSKKLSDQALYGAARNGGSFSDSRMVAELSDIKKELKAGRPDDVVERHGRLMRATRVSKDHIQYVRANVMGDFV